MTCEQTAIAFDCKVYTCKTILILQKKVRVDSEEKYEEEARWTWNEFNFQ
jgi:hypothetical protein